VRKWLLIKQTVKKKKHVKKGVKRCYRLSWPSHWDSWCKWSGLEVCPLITFSLSLLLLMEMN